MEVEKPIVPEEFEENLNKYRMIVYFYDGKSLNAISKITRKAKATCSR